jgi:hypothetical protein
MKVELKRVLDRDEYFIVEELIDLFSKQAYIN